MIGGSVISDYAYQPVALSVEWLVSPCNTNHISARETANMRLRSLKEFVIDCVDWRRA